MRHGLRGVNAIGRILVPVDGSESSTQAIDFSIALAKRQGAEIAFCHSVDLTGAIASGANPYNVMDVTPIVETLEDESKAVLGAAAALAAAAGVPATTRELAGPPVGAVLDVLFERRFDAVVMGTHGRRGASRFFLGSTAEGVLRRADVPVFVVSQSVTGGAAQAAFSSIAVAFDDSDPADAALAFALDLAVPGKTTLVVAHAVDVREVYALAASERNAATAAIAEERESARRLIDAAAARARERGISAEAVLLEGDPCESLQELVSERGIDLVAIGTHGRRGIRRLFLGSVAEGVVRTARVHVAVVRARAERRERT